MTAIPRDIATLLDGGVVVHLATTNPDGSPQVSPIWIERDGDVLRFGTAEGRAKLRNLRRDPRLAISITDPADREAGTVIRGRALSIERRGWDLIDRLARKYRGDTSFPRVDGMVRVDVEVGVERIVAS